jgi:hypothetical protein
MSASAVNSQIGSRTYTGRFEFVSHATVLRVLLLGGCLASIALAAWVGRAEAYPASDADLARLLRGMALIKGFLALAAVAVLLWRFGHPLSQRMAAAYLVGAWLATGASMMVWQLTLIPLAALTFHLGEITMLLTAWRDRTGKHRNILA